MAGSGRRRYDGWLVRRECFRRTYGVSEDKTLRVGLAWKVNYSLLPLIHVYVLEGIPTWCGTSFERRPANSYT